MNKFNNDLMVNIISSSMFFCDKVNSNNNNKEKNKTKRKLSKINSYLDISIHNNNLLIRHGTFRTKRIITNLAK